MIQQQQKNMINEQAIIVARQKVGKHLKSIREEKNLTCYAVAKLSGLSIGQVQSIERGGKAYTIDSFLKIIHALDAHFFMEDKEGKHFLKSGEKKIKIKNRGRKII